MDFKLVRLRRERVEALKVEGVGGDESGVAASTSRRFVSLGTFWKEMTRMKRMNSLEIVETRR